MIPSGRPITQLITSIVLDVFQNKRLKVCDKALAEGRPRAERVGSRSTAPGRGLGSSVQPEKAKAEAESSPLGEDVR